MNTNIFYNWVKKTTLKNVLHFFLIFISQFYIPGKSLASAKNGLKMYLLDLNL